MLRRPSEDHVLMFQLGQTQQANLNELVEERNVLRLRLRHEVDFTELVERSHIVVRLLQLAQSNRLALGEAEDGNQHFCLPGEQKWEQVDVRFKLDRVLSLDDFIDRGGRPAAQPKRSKRRRA